MTTVVVKPVVRRVVVNSPRRGPSQVPTVSTPAALSGLLDVVLATGARAFVVSRRAWFVLDKASVAAPNGDTVIAATAGNWLRLDDVHPANAAQATWYVDPANALANDDNSGLTALLPLSSGAELARRVGAQWIIDHAVDLYIASSCSDLPNITVRNTGTLRVRGTATVLASGTLSAVVAAAPSTNTPWTVTGTGLGALVAQHALLTITAGANSGRSAWLAAVVSGDNVRISTPVDWTSGLVSGSGAIADGDAFEAHSLPVIDCRDWYIDTSPVSGSLPLGCAVFENLVIRGNATPVAVFFGSISSNANVHYRNVEFRYLYHRRAFPIECNPKWDLCSHQNQCGVDMNGGLICNNGGYIYYGSAVVTHSDPMVQGTILRAVQGSVLNLRGICFFDCANPLALQDASIVRTSGHRIWGSGNTGTKFTIGAGCFMSYDDGAAWNISGGNDFVLEGRSSGTAIDPATDVETAATATTIANLNMAATPRSIVSKSALCGVVYSPTSV